jgi:acyl-CoA dehydrogenase
LADSVFALQCLGTQPVRQADVVSLHQEWLDRARSGEAMAAFAMTEESAGSDVGGMETRARREGDDWVLDGGKKFISNAGLADFYLVLAVTAPDEKRPGLSFFMVPAETEGLRFAGELVMSEPHPLGSIALENCRVPGSALVGEENAGFRIGLATLDALRPTVAAAACGMAARALDEAVAYARKRQQFGRALSEFQLVQQKLAVMATELDAARLLTYRAAASADRGQEGVTRQSAMAKWYATEAAQRVIDQAVQIHGGSGVLAESVVDRLYRSIRALRVYEGTTEIQQLVVARDLLKERSPGA